MHASLLLSAALVSPAAPLPRDAETGAGPAPRVLAVKADNFGAVRVIGTVPTKVTVTTTQVVIENAVENGKQVQKQVQKQVEQDIVSNQYFNKTLADFGGKFATADGAALTLDEATARVKSGATLLASSDGKPVAKTWLRAVAADTVVMVADGLSHAQIQWGADPLPTTPAPRLTRLGTDASGKIVATCTSAPTAAGLGYYDDFAFEGRALRGGKMWRGGYSDGAPTPAALIVKPLAEVTFDAYDLTGKRIGKSDALKRIAAGGTVLVAGDTRIPDETYLKAFKDDVLVLVSSELVLPVTPVDQTTKKKAADEKKAEEKK